MTLGKRIKVARERLRPKMTQAKLGEALGVTDKAVSGWERDEGVPTPDKMAVLRRQLRVTYKWLWEGGNTRPPAPDDPMVELDDLSSSQQEAVAAFIKMLLQQSGKAA